MRRMGFMFLWVTAMFYNESVLMVKTVNVLIETIASRASLFCKHTGMKKAVFYLFKFPCNTGALCDRRNLVNE